LSIPKTSSPAVLIPAQTSPTSLWGYIDSSGKWVVPAKLQSAGKFTEGLAPIRENGRSGYINEKGSLAIQEKYSSASDFSEGLALVTESSTTGKGTDWEWIDTSGRTVISANWDYPGSFNDGLAPVKRGNLWGYINQKGDVAIPLKFDGVGDFSEGLALVEVDGKLGYIDKSGVQRIQLESDMKPPRGGILPVSELAAGAGKFKNGLALITKPDNGGAYFIDKTGKKVFGREFESAGEFSEGLAPVEVDNKWGFIDTNGHFAIQPQLEDAGSLGGYGYSYGADGFHDGLAYFVEKGGKWGYMDRTGKVVIPPRFYLAYPYFMFGVPGFNLVLIDRNTMAIIDKSGKIIYSMTNTSGFGD
jgi:hypothetical protein